MSVGGLFVRRGHNQGRAFAVHRARSRINRTKLNAFAEALANGLGVGAAAHSVGVCQQRGTQMLKRLKAEIGWQAQ